MTGFETFEELIKSHKIEKSHKYIRRWKFGDEWRYEMPKDQKRNVGHKEAKENIAKRTKLITGIKPLTNATEKQIDEALVKLSIYAMDGKLKCPALGNHSVYITNRTQEHIKESRGTFRTVEAMQHKARYIPFIPELLKNGKISEKSRSKEGTIYGIIGQVEYFDDNKKKTVKESVELAINFDKNARKFVFSFADTEIKKSLLESKDFFMTTFAACPVGACNAEALSTTSNNVPHNYNNVNRNINISISEITEGNRGKKYEQLEKCLSGGIPEYIPADNTPRLGTVNITLKDGSRERMEKALRTMAMSLSVPLKAAKGEIFFYKAQEDLTDKWCMFFSELVRNTYDFITDYLDLPKKTVMSKSDVLTHKGKILYNPSTGEPIKQSDWNKFVGNLEKFLNRNIKDVEKKIVLESKSLSKILNRILKYNSLEDVKNLRLNDVSYHGKSFDWISENVKNMQNAFGESLTRQEQARIEVMTQSAAQKVTNITDKMRGNIKQILIDGVKNKQSKGQVSQALFDKMVGDNRDFQRVADTEIQNAFNNSFVQEEVYNTEEGKKTYFKRIEVIDDNTCPKCKAINGKIAVWSDKPLNDEKSKDKNADYVIWEGKEGSEWELPLSVKHPYCRGTWARYDVGLDSIDIDALVAEQSRNAKKWNSAVDEARKEYKDKGIENPDDSTKGFSERIKELYNGDDVKKSLTYSGYKLQGKTSFRGLNISIENKKGTIRRGVDTVPFEGFKQKVLMKKWHGKKLVLN